MFVNACAFSEPRARATVLLARQFVEATREEHNNYVNIYVDLPQDYEEEYYTGQRHYFCCGYQWRLATPKELSVSLPVNTSRVVHATS